MIAVVSERLMSPAWGAPEGLQRILRAFMSRVKKWTDQALENSIGWGFWAFQGPRVDGMWDKEIKQLNALFFP